jgi:hypothetical protein
MPAKRLTIPYGAGPKDRRNSTSGARRRASATTEAPPEPLISPLPVPVSEPQHSTTSVTQPMPTLTEPIAVPRPAIPPPGMPAHGEEPSGDAAVQKGASRPATAGVYRYAAPPRERRKKR